MPDCSVPGRSSLVRMIAHPATMVLCQFEIAQLVAEDIVLGLNANQCVNITIVLVVFCAWCVS